MFDWSVVMSRKQEISTSLNEIWAKLSLRWKDEDSRAFYQQYIVKMAEVVETFEDTCSDLSVGATDLAKKLELIEHDIT